MEIRGCGGRIVGFWTVSFEVSTLHPFKQEAVEIAV
jgi:hypothetical protein